MDDCKLKLINQTENGRVYLCESCKKAHFEYKNLNFVFSEKEFEFFKQYFLTLDYKHWEKINQDSAYNKKIMVPIGHANFTAAFNGSEIVELRTLMSKSNKTVPKLKLVDLKMFERQVCVN